MAVKEKYGEEFNSWRYAEKRSVTCEEVPEGWVCTRSGVPCRDVLHSVVGGTFGNMNCKDDAFRGVGRRERTEEKAIEQALWAWRHDTGREYGKEWSIWDNARESKIDCRKVGGGTQCTAIGIACIPK